jgi:phospholipid transport system substrate-binding protein
MRSLIGAFCALLFLALPVRAQSTDAQAFIATNIASAFAILDDAALTAEARAAKLETHLLALTDLPRVATFTLGSAIASPAQREAFVAAFRDYALASWRTQFLLFRGGTMTVTGSRLNAPGDVVVRTQLRDGSGLEVPLEFRVRTDGPKPLIVDIGFAGIWLALTQRDDFAAALARNGGNVEALTTNLSARAASLRTAR